MTQNRSEDAPGESKDDKTKKIDISSAQVAGGALASVTAAFLGGQLGVAGTVGGAALTSVVITVGGEVYRRSLESTRDKANVAAAKAALKRVKARPVSGADESTRRIDTGSIRYGEQEMHWPGGERVVDDRDEQRTRRIELPGRQEPPTAAEHPPPSRRRIRWVVIAVTSGLAFVLCMLIVTSFEGITGRTLSGGEGGTTVGHLVRPGPQQDQPPVPPPEESTTTAPEPSRQSSSTADPTVEPSRGEPTRERGTERSTPTRRTQTPEPEPSRTGRPESTPSRQQEPQRDQQQQQPTPEGNQQQEQRVVPSGGDEYEQ